MASLSRGISFRRQGSSGMSWTDTWSFNEEGVLVRTMKEGFAGSGLSRIHDSHVDEHEESSPPFPTCPPSPPPSLLARSKSVGSAHLHPTPLPPKPSPKFFKWIKKALHKLKK